MVLAGREHGVCSIIEKPAKNILSTSRTLIHSLLFQASQTFGVTLSQAMGSKNMQFFGAILFSVKRTIPILSNRRIPRVTRLRLEVREMGTRAICEVPVDD